MTNETNDLKAGTNAPIHVLIPAFQEFAVREASEGILLLLCTVAALLWISSPLAARYEALWKANLRWEWRNLYSTTISASGSMTVSWPFSCFVVGLELERELLVGNWHRRDRPRYPSWGAGWPIPSRESSCFLRSSMGCWLTRMRPLRGRSRSMMTASTSVIASDSMQIEKRCLSPPRPNVYPTTTDARRPTTAIT